MTSPTARLTAGYRVDDNGCWIWQRAVDPNGYGRMSLDGRMLGAHRVAYQLLVGPIPDGLDLDHLCRNRACVNPEHLEPVSRRTNLVRGETLTRAHVLGEDCGHELCVSCRHRAERPVFDVDMRAITRDDIALCHALLDDLDVPRLCDAGLPLSLRWRLTHLVAVSKRVAS